jgi:ABC-type branched-subunit amino acid transport system ATPase component
MARPQLLLIDEASMGLAPIERTGTIRSRIT